MVKIVCSGSGSEDSVESMKLHRQIDLRNRRRVLVAGDVHGDFDLLASELAEMGWDPAQDELVLLGDLVDRGPDSMRAMDWIDTLRVLGNHEEIALLIARREIEDEEWVRRIGAGWIWDMDRSQAREVAARLNHAPVALTLTTPAGRRIGICHADCPSEWDWVSSTLEGEENGERREMVRKCLWSRDHGLEIMEAHHEGRPQESPSGKMTGVDHVFHGHTITGRPFIHGDRSWIDTGSAMTGRLTVVDADRWLDYDDMHRIYE